MSIDLALLPPPDIIDPLDYEAILAARKQRLVGLYPEQERAAIQQMLELESEPIVKLLQESAYRELNLRQRINDGARAVMLAFSGGGDLDHLLALLDAQRLDDETDSEFRERGRLAPFGYSTAGPTNAYRYHAMSASSEVRDARVDRPAPGVVRVTVLPRSAEYPAQELIDTISAALNADDIRPLNDTVMIEPAFLVGWEIRARIFVGPGAAPEPLLEAARSAAEKYATKQHAIGAPVRLSGIFAALHQPGAQRVELDSPAADIEPGPQHAPLCTGINIELVTSYD